MPCPVLVVVRNVAAERRAKHFLFFYVVVRIFPCAIRPPAGCLPVQAPVPEREVLATTSALRGCRSCWQIRPRTNARESGKVVARAPLTLCRILHRVKAFACKHSLLSTFFFCIPQGECKCAPGSALQGAARLSCANLKRQ